MAQQRLTINELGDLRRAFEAFDTDGSWRLTVGEVQAMFRVLGVDVDAEGDELQKWFRQLDKESGALDFDEFVKLYVELKAQRTCTLAAATAIMSKRPHERTAEELQRLANFMSSSVAFFSYLNRPVLIELCRVMTVQQHKPGEWLWEQQTGEAPPGGPHDDMHCVLEGAVTLWQHPTIIRRALAASQRQATMRSVKSGVDGHTTSPSALVRLRSIARGLGLAEDSKALTDAEHPGPASPSSRANLSRAKSMRLEVQVPAAGGSAAHAGSSTPHSPKAGAGTPSRSATARRVLLPSESKISHFNDAPASPGAARTAASPATTQQRKRAIIKQVTNKLRFSMPEDGSGATSEGDAPAGAPGTKPLPTLPPTAASRQMSKSTSALGRFRAAAVAMSMLQRATQRPDAAPAASASEEQSLARHASRQSRARQRDAGSSAAGLGKEASVASCVSEGGTALRGPRRARHLWHKAFLAVKFFRRVAQLSTGLDGEPSGRSRRGPRRTKVPRATQPVISGLLTDGCMSSLTDIARVPLSIVAALHEIADSVVPPSDEDEDEDDGLDVSPLAPSRAVSTRLSMRASLRRVLSRASLMPGGGSSDDDEGSDGSGEHGGRAKSTYSAWSRRSSSSAGGGAGDGHDEEDDDDDGAASMKSGVTAVSRATATSRKSVAFSRGQPSLARSKSKASIASFHHAQSMRRKPHNSPIFVGFCMAGSWMNEQALLPALGAPDAKKPIRVGGLAASFVTCVRLSAHQLARAIAACTGGLHAGGADDLSGKGGAAFHGAGIAHQHQPSDGGVFQPEYLMWLAQKPAAHRTMCEEAVLCHYLAQVPSFKQLPHELRLRLSRALIPQSYARGELVMRQGDMPHAMYLVVSGSVGTFHDPDGPLSSGRGGRGRAGVTAPRTSERVHGSSGGGEASSPRRRSLIGVEKALQAAPMRASLAGAEKLVFFDHAPADPSAAAAAAPPLRPSQAGQPGSAAVAQSPAPVVVPPLALGVEGALQQPAQADADGPLFQSPALLMASPDAHTAAAAGEWGASSVSSSIIDPGLIAFEGAVDPATQLDGHRVHVRVPPAAARAAAASYAQSRLRAVTASDAAGSTASGSIPSPSSVRFGPDTHLHLVAEEEHSASTAGDAEEGPAGGVDALRLELHAGTSVPELLPGGDTPLGAQSLENTLSSEAAAAAGLTAHSAPAAPAAAAASAPATAIVVPHTPPPHISTMTSMVESRRFASSRSRLSMASGFRESSISAAAAAAAAAPPSRQSLSGGPQAPHRQSLSGAPADLAGMGGASSRRMSIAGNDAGAAQQLLRGTSMSSAAADYAPPGGASRRQSLAGVGAAAVAMSALQHPAAAPGGEGGAPPGWAGSRRASLSGVGDGARGMRQSMTGSSRLGLRPAAPRASGDGQLLLGPPREAQKQAARRVSSTGGAAAAPGVRGGRLPGGRSLVPTVSKLSHSAHERRAVMASDQVNTAAAIRAKHAAMRASGGSGSGAAVALTEGHAESAAKLAAMMMGGDTYGNGARRSAAANNEYQIAELEKTLGKMQQQLGSLRTIGEQELINIPRGTGNGQAVTTFMPATYLRRRECSALAFVDCHMFQIEVQVYRECLLEWRRRELAERLAFLQEVSCCRQLKQQALMAMDNSLQWITVPRGSVLQALGSPLQGLLLIKEGTIGVYHAGPRACAQHVLDRYAAAAERLRDSDEPITTLPAGQRASIADAVSVHTRQRPLSAGPTMSMRPGFAASVAPSTLGGGTRMSTSGRPGSAAARRGPLAAPPPGGTLFGSRIPLRCVGLLGEHDFAGEDGLLTGSHKVTLVAETEVKVALLRAADMTVLEDSGIRNLLHSAKQREAARSDQSAKGPDLWAYGGDGRVTKAGAAAGDGQDGAAAEEAEGASKDATAERQPEGWTAPGTGVALALGAYAKPKPLRPTALQTRAAAVSVLPKQVTSTANREPDMQLYQRWMDAVQREAAQEAIRQGALQDLAAAPQPHTAEAAAPDVPTEAELEEQARAGLRVAEACGDELPMLSVGLSPKPRLTSDSQAPELLDGSLRLPAASPTDALPTSEEHVGTAGEEGAQRTDAGNPGAELQQRALAMLSAARAPLVFGKHKAPAHVVIKELPVLAKPPELHQVLPDAAATGQPASAAKEAGLSSASSASPDQAAAAADGHQDSLAEPQDAAPPPMSLHHPFAAAAATAEPADPPAEPQGSPAEPAQPRGVAWASNVHDGAPLPTVPKGRALQPTASCTSRASAAVSSVAATLDSLHHKQRLHAALHAAPLVAKPHHLISTTSCLDMVSAGVVPGVLSCTSAGVGDNLAGGWDGEPQTAEDRRRGFSSNVFEGRTAVLKARSAQPAWQYGRKQAALHREALNTLLQTAYVERAALQPEQKVLLAATARRGGGGGGVPGLTRLQAQGNVSLLYAHGSRAGPAVLGSLNTGAHFSSAALTSSRWLPGRPDKQAAFITRTTALEQANARDAQALGLTWWSS